MWLKINVSQVLLGTFEKLGSDADPILSLKNWPKINPVTINISWLNPAFNGDKIRLNKHLDRPIASAADCFDSYNLRSAQTLLLTINQYICHNLSRLLLDTL